MASVSKDAKGLRIRLVDQNGSQKTLRPGKITKRAAEQVARYMESLVAAKASNQPVERQTALWVADVPDGLYSKLARLKLVEPRIEPDAEPEGTPLAEFLAEHIGRGRTAKDKPAATSTVEKWGSTAAFLNTCFGPREVESITKSDAHDFLMWLESRRIKPTDAEPKGQPLATNAKRKHIANCKMFFNAAIRRGLIELNPFRELVSGTEANRSRDFYVTPEMTQRLIESTPDAQWRLMIALWRLAGLRKMEIFNLTWGDIQWDNGKFLVRSTKTDHVEGCEMRFVPIRDVQSYLEDAFQLATSPERPSLPADAPVITRFNPTNSNLYKPFKQIIVAAGMLPWSKLFQNLRASCETQWLKEGARADLVANWIGHSVKVQRMNYVQETDDDIHNFNASKSGHPGGHADARNGAKTRKVAIPVAID